MSQFDDILGYDPLPIDTRSEKAIQNDALVELTALPDSMFWQNTTGKAWQGQKVSGRIGSMVRLEPGMVILRNARPITFGLPGSGDILGAVRGRAVAVEVKDMDGRQRETQERFQGAWTRAGGLYVLGRSAQEIVVKVNEGLNTTQ